MIRLGEDLDFALKIVRKGLKIENSNNFPVLGSRERCPAETLDMDNRDANRKRALSYGDSSTASL